MSGVSGVSGVKTVLVVRGDTVTDAILVPAAATVSTDGKSAIWDGDALDAPDGSTFAMVDGGAIGDTWDGKTLTPALLPPKPTSVTPLATGRQIFGQVKAAGVSGAFVAYLGKTPKPDDALYWYGIGLDTLVPTDNPKVGRLLIGAGVTDVPGFMTAALALVA